MKKSIEIETIIQKICQGTDEIIFVDQLIKKLLENRPLKIKLGADPSSPNLHLGHIVVLEKLHDFQKLGHEIIFLIGNFTACIGDPTGKSKTRPVLSSEEVKQNTKTYIEQIGRVLDITKVKIVYNKDWFDEFKGIDWIKLLSKTTVAQIIQRDDFSNRLQNRIPIGLHELLYPLLQGYDSVVLNSDIEIGGTDQKFNMLIGRQLQEAMGCQPQLVIIMPIIEGLDGVQKMSKSLKNEIALMDSDQNAFIKIMSINDKLMKTYFKAILRFTEEKINDIIKQYGYIEAKKILAYQIISRYWSEAGAKKAFEYFTNIVQNKNYDINSLKEVQINCKEYKLVDLIVYVNPTLSRSSARRLIESSSVAINNIKVKDINFIYRYNGDRDILRIGKQILVALVM